MGARPGGKELLDKNHEEAFVSWPGGPSELRVVDCGMRIEKQRPQKIRNPQFEIRNGKADAFCPEAPCPRTTTKASRNCQPLKSSSAESGICQNEIRPAMGSGPCFFSANIHHKLLGSRFGIKKCVGAGFKPAPAGFQILAS